MWNTETEHPAFMKYIWWRKKSSTALSGELLIVVKLHTAPIQLQLLVQVPCSRFFINPNFHSDFPRTWGHTPVTLPLQRVSWSLIQFSPTSVSTNSRISSQMLCSWRCHEKISDFSWLTMTVLSVSPSNNMSVAKHELVTFDYKVLQGFSSTMETTMPSSSGSRMIWQPSLACGSAFLACVLSFNTSSSSSLLAGSLSSHSLAMLTCKPKKNKITN